MRRSYIDLVWGTSEERAAYLPGHLEKLRLDLNKIWNNTRRNFTVLSMSKRERQGKCNAPVDDTVCPRIGNLRGHA